MVTRTVFVRDIPIGSGHPLVLIGGPCVLEDPETNRLIASRLKETSQAVGVPLIFKASYDKGNRGLGSSYRGPMLEAGLEQLSSIRDEFDIPVLTDVHSEREAAEAAKVVDMIQIPAYLSMQTSLVTAAASTGKPLNVKKGQFLSPDSVSGIIQKAESCGNDQVMLTERGTFFGYNNLVTDMRALPTMRSFGVPVVFDPTHIIRKPGISSSAPEGGQPEFVPFLSRAAAATGIDAIFIETHPCPSRARCDACSMYPLDWLEELLGQVKTIHELVSRWKLDIPQRNEKGFLV